MKIFTYFFIRNYYKMFYCDEVIKILMSNRIELGEVVTSGRHTLKNLGKGNYLFLK